jgi:hypothetical protein
VLCAQLIVCLIELGNSQIVHDRLSCLNPRLSCYTLSVISGYSDQQPRP